MPLLNPTDIATAAAVIAVGKNSSEIQKQISSEFQEFLNIEGASKQQCASVIARVMNYAERDGDKLAAAKLALQAHEVLTKDGDVGQEVKSAPVFNFIFQDSNVNLAGVFNPTREN